jgi:hypothetical protein
MLFGVKAKAKLISKHPGFVTNPDLFLPNVKASLHDVCIFFIFATWNAILVLGDVN